MRHWDQYIIGSLVTVGGTAPWVVRLSCTPSFQAGADKDIFAR